MADLLFNHEHIHLGREKPVEQKPKTLLEKLPFRKEKVTEKEKAEKEYIKKIDTDHPEQSPYVVKSAKSVQQAVPAAKSKTYLALEKILSENLESYYQTLDLAKQQAFKQKGEETATKIDEMITTFKTKARRVLQLLKEWLLMVPGINKFFLEQEAKIKTQKIMDFSRQYKKENKNKW